MSFQPVVPGGGLAGWTFLTRTRPQQQAAFGQSPAVQRAESYFRENIGKIRTAEDLVADRRLLQVALGAFGLDEDLPNKFFIRKVLDEGTQARDAFANKLADKRYFELSRAFRFDLDPPNTALGSFADKILDAYQTRQFEIAVGDSDEGLRLALGFGREMETLAAKGMSQDAMWYTIMATPPLRTVIEGALGLPAATGALDVDRQLGIFKSRAAARYGSSDPSRLTDPALQEKVIRRYLLTAESGPGVSAGTPGSAALALLQAGRTGGGLFG